MATEGIGNPVRLRAGYFDGQHGVFWAWPVDGYYDLHHSPDGVYPDGSEVIGEGYWTLKDARDAARSWHNGDDKVVMRRIFA